MTGSADRLLITQTTGRAVIDWGGFSVGSAQSVHFDNGTGATLNRVTGGSISRIDGTLSASGSVFVLNPNGVIIGRDGAVNVGGSFVASTLALGTDSFMAAGAQTFAGESTAEVVNFGRISALGGDVALIGQQVANHGQISAPNGTAALIAGREVLMRDAALADGRFVVRLGGANDRVLNTGDIAAAEVELRANHGNVLALAGNTGGVIRADGVAAQGGRIFLTAPGGQVRSEGRLQARRGQGGGAVVLNAAEISVDGFIDVSALAGPGGAITVEATEITLGLSSRLDASGATGGLIRVGGDLQGGAVAGFGAPILNAESLRVDSGAVLRADGLDGDGGQIVLWADDTTRFEGDISATATGVGGFVEVSGARRLDYRGRADLRGAAGLGTLLLDPHNITIAAAGGAGFTADSDDSVIASATLLAALEIANVTVFTGATGSQDGDVTVAAALDWDGPATLTLQAAGAVNITSAVTAAFGGLTIQAGSTATASAPIDVQRFRLASGDWVQHGTLADFSARDFRITGSASFRRTTGGDGTVATPYVVSDVYGLQGIGSSAAYRAASWQLGGDIDAYGTAAWNDGAGWVPIASFSGNFDGGGHSISGLTSIGGSNRGFFAHIEASAAGSTIRDLAFHDAWVQGDSVVGVLAGSLNAQTGGATLSDIRITQSTVTGTGNDLGLLTGRVYGRSGQTVTITDIALQGSVDATTTAFGQDVGGVAGQLAAFDPSTGVNVSRATVDVDVRAVGQGSGRYSRVGGVFGHVYTSSSTTDAAFVSVADVHSFGSLWASSESAFAIDRFGGLIGLMNGSYGRVVLSRSASYGDVSVVQTGGGDVNFVGGVAGYAFSLGWGAVSLSDVFATGSLYIETNRSSGTNGVLYVGGVAGALNVISGVSALSEAARFYSTSSISIIAANAHVSYVGGSIGAIINSSSMVVGLSQGWASGPVTLTAGTQQYVGGFAGRILHNSSEALSVTNMSWDIDTTGQAVGVGTITGTPTVSVTGLTGAQPYETASYTGFDFTNDWYLAPDRTRPLLRAFYSTDIATPEQLQMMGADLTASYTLTRDIDLGAALAPVGSVWRDGNFAPVGPAFGTPFSGNFDGGGYTIDGLRIDRPGDEFIGLFGHLNSGAGGSTVQNVTLSNVSLSGRQFVGGLAGRSWVTGGDLTLDTVTVTGTLNGSPNFDTRFLGGLIGYVGVVNGRSATIQNITTDVAISVTTLGTARDLGGIFGNLESVNAGTVTQISNVWAAGSITTDTNSFNTDIGGIVGYLRSDTGASLTLSDALMTGTVTVSGQSYIRGIGGVVGRTLGSSELEITRAFVSGGVSASVTTPAGFVSDDIGGLVGLARLRLVLTDSAHTGAISVHNAYAGPSTLASRIGGLVGYAWGSDATSAFTFQRLYSSGSIFVNSPGAPVMRVGGGVGFVSHNASTAGSMLFDQIHSSSRITYVVGPIGISQTGGVFGSLSATHAGAIAVTNTYWDQDTSLWFIGAGTSTNVTGAAVALSGTAPFEAASYAGFDFANDWFMIEGETRPFLRAEHSTTLRTANQVQLIAMDLTADYTLARNIDLGAALGQHGSMWTARGFVPLGDWDGGNAASHYSGVMDGRHYLIDGLRIDRPDRTYTGLFGVTHTGAILRNMALTTVEVTGAQAVGGLIGYNQGLVQASFTTGSVSSPLAGVSVGVGGIAGYNTAGGVIETSWSAATAYGKAAVGGLVGANVSGGTVRQSYSTGAATAVQAAGGLVGDQNTNSHVSDSWSTAAVHGLANFAGSGVNTLHRATLVGVSYGNSTIQRSWGGGPVTAAAGSRGGVVDGMWSGGQVLASFWDTTTSGVNAASGGTGLTTAQMQDTMGFYTQAVAGGWDFEGVWAPSEAGHHAQLYATNAVVRIDGTALRRVYGDTNPVFTRTLRQSGGPGQYVFAAANDWLDLSPSSVLTSTATSGSALGLYAISSGIAGNHVSDKGTTYRVVDLASVLQVTARPLTFTGTAENKVYDGTTAATLSGSLVGVVFADAVSLTNAAFAQSNVGTGIAVTGATLGGAQAGNYQLVPFAGLTADITPAALTVTADAQSRVYGAADPALSFAATGFVLGEDASVLTGALTRAAGENVGSYAITQGTLAASNYTISFAGANFAITPAALTVTADAQSRVYGAADPALSFAATGFVLGEDASVLTGGLARAAGETVGNYAITQGTLAGANYAISFTGANFAITPAALTVTADAQSRVYGAADPALSFAATGFALGEDASVLTGGLARATGENVGSYAITQGTLAGTNYAISFTGANFAITPAALTVTADAQSRVYGAAGPALTFNATGFVLGEDASVLTGALTRAAGENVGTYAITQGTLAASNYTISFAGANFAITPSTLTVTADAQSRVYGAADPALTFAATGFVLGEDTSVLTGALARAAGENVGSYAIVQGTLAGANYTISFTGANFAITPAALTVTADAQSRVYGAADPALTFAATGFVLGEDASVLTGGLTRAEGETVGSYAITQGTLAGSNYTISFTGANFAITPAALTVTADAQSRVYGAADPALTFAATGFVLGEDASVLTGALTRAAGENVGSYAITQGTLSGANYAISFTGANFAITPAALTVTADAQSRVYGATDPSLTFAATGFVLGEDASVLTGALTRAAGENVGTYAITQGTLAASNYTISFAGANFAITPAALTVTAHAQSRVYGAADPVLSFGTAGLVGGDTEATALTGALTRAAGENVGSYAITQGTLAASNYTISFAGANFAITPAALTVTANAQSRVYGATDPVLSFGTAGLVGGDTEATALTGALTRAAGENVGTYAITQGTLAAANYTISFAGANFAITPAALTVTAAAQSRVYGASDPVLSFGTAGLVGGDTAATALTGALTRAAGENVGTYAITQGTLAAANYTISFTGANFAITPAALTVAADAQSRVYGSADPALTFAATGFVLGEDASVLTGALTRAAGENVGTYAITQGTLAAANYTISFAGANFAITPAALTVTADGQSRVYGATDPSLSFAATGFVLGEDASVLTGALTRAVGENVGSYAITQGTLAGSNYAISFTGANFAITPAALTVTANPQSKFAGQSDPAFTWSLTSGALLFGDLLTGDLSRDPGEAVGDYAITQGTLVASMNYALTFTPGIFTINPVAQVADVVRFVPAGDQGTLFLSSDPASDPDTSEPPLRTCGPSDAEDCSATPDPSTMGEFVRVAQGTTESQENQ